MSNRFLELALCAAFAAGATWILTPRAVDAGGSLLGAGDGGTVIEPITWKTDRGTLNEAKVQRALIKIPKAYGDVIQIVPDRDGSTVIWLRDASDGTLRNAIVPAMGLVMVGRD